MTGPSLQRLLVVVPARDEEALVGGCLGAVADAVDVLHATHPGLDVATVLVADGCRDATAEIAHAAGVHVVRTDGGCVGAARRAGVDAGVALLPPAPDDRTWIASTDADSRVPAAWLLHQVALAARGTHLVVGLAVPDPADLDHATWTTWRGRHTSTEIAAHVHGANLGLRYDAYLAAGGWPRLPEHEDRHLVEAVLATGVAPERGLDVVTSGRLHGRVDGGFSGYLRTITPPEVAPGRPQRHREQRARPTASRPAVTE